MFTDISRKPKGVEPQYLNFDLRRLDPGEYNAPYHFHRYAEELFWEKFGHGLMPVSREVVGGLYKIPSIKK